ncbi:circadian clock KaiB family protein [Pseudohaliea sp.]|uniref:circadian clock KaiB family protein n=1 Tax=Pseudohaliea sp. TaxID=2740289 RepID=UPI0032EE7FEC
MTEKLILKIYIAGMTPAALRALRNLREICESFRDDGNFDISVIDILQHPQLAEDEKILATPTVVRSLPPPIRKLVGDLTDREQAILGLDLVAVDE